MLNPYESPVSASDAPAPSRQRGRLALAWFVGTLAAMVVGLTAGIGYQLAWLSCLAAIVLPGAAIGLTSSRRRSFLFRIALYAAIGWYLGYVFQPAVSSRHRQPTPAPFFMLAHGLAALLTGVGVGFECLSLPQSGRQEVDEE